MGRILVVDDQDMMRDSLASTLVREGHEVQLQRRHRWRDGENDQKLSDGGKFGLCR